LYQNNITRNNRINSARQSDARRNAAMNRSIDRANRTTAARNAATRAETQRTFDRAATIDRANRGMIVDRTNRNAGFRGNTANAPIVNNWRSQRFSGNNYAAFRDYRREWHNRDWWHNHYSRITLVGGGWWYWNAGYWYPAWGYDSSYSYYPYDGPIYGYGDLTPDQVIVNVQAQLQNNGYYAGTVDGILGPQTRRAIATFQADHGLAVTSAVDEPTLATLGLS